MKLQRSHLGEHLKSECEYRNVKCDYCGQDVAFASIKVRIKYLIENCDLIFNHARNWPIEFVQILGLPKTISHNKKKMVACRSTAVSSIYIYISGARTSVIRPVSQK